MASVWVNAGAHPFAVALVPGVQHVHHLIAAHAQRAAVRLSGDFEVDSYVEWVAWSQLAVHYIALETTVYWRTEHAVEFDIQYSQITEATQYESFSRRQLDLFFCFLKTFPLSRTTLILVAPYLSCWDSNKNITYSHNWLDSAAWQVQSSAAMSSVLLPECWCPMKGFGFPLVCTPQAGAPIRAQNTWLEAHFFALPRETVTER